MKSSKFIFRRINHPKYLAQSIAWFEKYRAFVEELKSRGFNVSPEFQWQNYAGTEFDSAVVNAVLAVIDSLDDINDRYKFTHFLCGTVTPYDPGKIIRVYDEVDKPGWKWDIIGTLAQSNPQGITEWFIQRLLDRNHPDIQEVMAAMIGSSREYERCREVLVDHYHEFALGAIEAFADAGTEIELEFLRNYNHSALKFTDPDAAKNYMSLLPRVLRKIESRISKRRRNSRGPKATQD